MISPVTGSTTVRLLSKRCRRRYPSSAGSRRCFAREASPPGRAFRAGYPIAVDCAFAASRLCHAAPQPLATQPLGFYEVSLRSVRAGMTSPHQIERQRGIKEASQQLGALRERWPLAFPVRHQDIRPLAFGVAHQVAAGMGWSLPYTLSVLRRWKMAAVYCQAVLSHDQRIALDGTPAETVGPSPALGWSLPMSRATDIIA